MKIKYPPIDTLVTEAAGKYPKKTAIQYGEQQVTYEELERQSNRIANFLYPRSCDSNRVLLCLDRSPELVEAVIGVMKSGLIFVPVDPNYPAAKIKQLLETTKAQWLVTGKNIYQAHRNLFDGQRLKVLQLDDAPDAEGIPTEITGDKLQFERKETRYAYIYYTSGSTGEPKGVLGRHRSLTHFIQWEIGEFGLNEDIRVSQLTTPSFDAYLRDVFVPLTVGGTVCIPEPEQFRDATLLVQWLHRENIHIIHSVPSVFRTLLRIIDNTTRLPALKYVLLSGEMMRGSDVNEFIQRFQHRAQLVNFYGPTETTMIKTFYRTKPQDAQRQLIPAGKPIDGTQIMILDDAMQKTLQGNVGEIYIRTPFITSGYIDNRQLTRERFVMNPFTGNPQDIIYKTGDQGKWLPDGNLMVLGRTDQQVKIRGARVELGEIENRISKYPQVKDNVVLAKEDRDGEKHLCAFLVPEPGQNQQNTFDPGIIRELLEKELPAFMVPAYYTVLDQLPLNTIGKVDRQALNQLPIVKKSTASYTAPENQMQQKLVEIWAEILGIENDIIGIDTNFFRLGGHSLNSTTLTARIHKQLNRKLPLEFVFRYPTVREMAEQIEILTGNNDGFETIEPAEEKEYYPLSASQNQLYFVQLLKTDNTAYQIPVVVEIDGILSPDKLEHTFRQLIAYHESLRTSFIMIDGKPVQKINREIDFSINAILVRDRESARQEVNRFIRPFDLSRPPLFRVGLLQIGHDKSILVVDMHHIITDGVSSDILMQDFSVLYEGKHLPPLKLQYKDYTQWQHRQKQGRLLKRQEAFWLKEFEGNIPELNIPTDKPRPEFMNFTGKSVIFELPARVEQALKSMALQEEATMFMILLAIYTTTLAKISGQDDIVVGTPVAGRRHADLQKIIGMFVNTLPLRNKPTADKPFTQFLAEVRKQALKAFENQDYQLEDLVNKLKGKRQTNRNPLFDTIFVFLGMGGTTQNTSRMKMKDYEDVRKGSKFDLNLAVTETAEGLGFMLQYSTELFEERTIRRYIGYFKEVAAAVAEDKNITLKNIEIDDQLLTTDAEIFMQDQGDFGF